jgi:biopolymer transport protein ExbD
MIRFQCHQCGKKLKAPEEYSGRAVQCTGCGAVQAVPAVEAAPAETRTQTIHPASPLEHVQPAAAAESGEEAPLLEHKTGMTDDGLDMTPMVDVTFLLLIFFMVTAAFALQKSINIPTPDPSESATESRTVEELEQDDDYIIVRIDKDNTIWVNDAEAPSEQELLAKLKEAREGPPGTTTKGPSKLLVMASGDAQHEKVVMALDAGTAVGMDDVRLANGDDDF